MRLLCFENDNELAVAAANYIVRKINAFNPSAEKPFILGLPTGSSPLKTYKQLIKLNQEGKVSFKNVVTFNMDEYIGIPRDHPQSYHTFMHENLFNHIDIPKDNINILDGNTGDHEKECQRYEDKLKSYGYAHLYLGGVGQDGHLAFNEPGSSLKSRTRIKTLVMDTKVANARFFDNDVSKVPCHALTIGIGTLMDSKEVLILANGMNKALAVEAAVQGSINQMWTVSILQMHPHASIMADADALMELKVKTVKYFKEIEGNFCAQLLKD